MLTANFNEDFLHYVWKTKQCYKKQLLTTSGDDLKIINFGNHNSDAGPDFSNVKIMINGVIWFGNIEIHINSSDWIKHKHTADHRYDNVILHVVFNHDKDIYINNRLLPTLELKDKIDPDLITNYQLLTTNTSFISCQNNLSAVPLIKKEMMLERMAIKRLEQKMSALDVIHQNVNYDWKATLYVILFRYMGGKLNAIPFERLAYALPYQMLLKNIHSSISVQSLLFGQAGFLVEAFKNTDDSYVGSLYSNFLHFRNKYKLTSLEPVIWKFSKTRPDNFPTVRIDQFSQLLQRDILNTSSLLRMDLKSLYNLLSVSSSEYWQTHYTFKSSSAFKEKRLGKTQQDILLINAIIPYIFYYGQRHNQQDITDHAIDLLHQIKGESNKFTRNWNKYSKHKLQNALQTQGLLTLYQEYCKKSKCASCTIGDHLLRGNVSRETS